MSSATYLAPGVYVEEVQSAQQPIAGVGTNVVGFIGIVPSKIYVPVLNPDYDPIAARAVAELAELRAAAGRPADAAYKARIEEETGDALRQLNADVRSGEKKLSDLNDKLAAAKQDVDATKSALDAANTALDSATQAFGNATDANRADLQKSLDKARDTQDKAEKSNAAAIRKASQLEGQARDQQAIIDDLKAQADATAPAAGQAADTAKLVEQDDIEFKDIDKDDTLLARSSRRPFILQEFTVKAECLETKLCTNFTEYTQRFGPFSAYKSEPDLPYDDPDRWTFSPMHPGHHALTHAVNGFFKNGGTKAFVVRIEREDQLEDALQKFRSIDELAIITAPGLPKTSGNWEELMTHVENRENCFAILDGPQVANDGDDNDLDVEKFSPTTDDPTLPRPCKNAAYYFPHIEVVDPAKLLQDGDVERKVNPKYRGRTYVPPSGHIAGIYARTDAERGVHKAPANCVVRGAIEVKYYISKPVQEMLNPQGVNAIRVMNGAVTVWGARTVGGDANSEWKYVSVRRLFLFLQKSIEEGTQWIVFEPNDEALWAKIRLNVSAFLTNVWRSGALFGATPDQAFYVKCDAELNPPAVRDLGQVITEIGVAIVRPAEFVIFRITQATGATRT